MAKYQNRNEFRKNKKSGHPAYIYAKVGNEFIYLGLTHSEITQGVKNIQLEHSPNPKETETVFVRPKSEKLKENKFSKQQYKNWSFTKNDQKKIDKIKKRTK